LLLESIALYWLMTGNDYHNSRVVKGMQGITRGIDARINNARNYFSLTDINTQLADENSRLRNRLGRLTGSGDSKFIPVVDTIYRQQYQYISARVIYNSVNNQKNYFTLDKGTRQGAGVEMAVISNSGAAGVIVGCSENFSVAISLLNLDFRLSSRIRKNGYFGSLGWDGHSYRYSILNEIPQHISVTPGDTIETTGFSASFPEGITVGTIKDVRKSGSDFYKITVELSTDFKKLQYVSIISNLKKTEELDLERIYR
ncbi:MAG: rod shape-determining protein MreC, partial [Bacteroidales bacterium]